MQEKPFITFGAQMGDIKAAEAVQIHLIELRRKLKKYCTKKYSEDIDELAPIARIDGDIWHWEFEGCEKLQINRIKRYITIDVGIPRSRWEDVEPVEIKQYLLISLRQALILMIEKLKAEGLYIDEESLFSDFSDVEKDYLSSF